MLQRTKGQHSNDIPRVAQTRQHSSVIVHCQAFGTVSPGQHCEIELATVNWAASEQGVYARVFTASLAILREVE